MSDFEDYIKTVIIEEGDIVEARRRWQPQYKDQRDDGGLTVLHYACIKKSGDREGLVRLLVSLGCGIETQDIDRRRPLHVCALNGNLEAMRALLEEGCSLSPLDEDGETPLMMADMMRNRECASLLRSSIKAILKQSMTDYVQGDVLGKGAFGYVYKCHDAKNRIDFAIKKVLVLRDNDAEINALQNEIKIYSKWDNHKRIVSYFDMTSNEKEMIIFMEYLPNGTLRDALTRFGQFSIKDVAKYSKQILEGLQFLHGHKIIHRDIKAANILRDYNDDIKLADFGISKSLQTITSNPKDEFSAIGTSCWMAPEVIQGTKYTFTADVWSLGATVLEMLTGNPPFYDLEGQAAMFKIGNGAPVDVYFPKDLDTETRLFLDKMFVHDPSDRADVKTLLDSPFVLCLQDGETSLMLADRRGYPLLKPSIKILMPSMTDYEEGDLLGKGGYGSVYKCNDANIKMDFAIRKVPILKDNVAEINALQNEIKVYSKLENHKRIVRYFGTSRNGKKMIIFMEYLPNGSLRDALTKFGPFSIKEVAKYSRQILEGLQFLHGHEIIHRDIKAANILRDSNDDIKLAEFGIKKFLQTKKSNKDDQLSAIESHCWMAPEVIQGTNYTFTTDVWSLGATFLEMLTGNPPFYDLEGQAAMFKIGNGAPVDVYFPKDLDTETKFFLDKMFVQDPSYRADVKTLLVCPFVRDA